LAVIASADGFAGWAMACAFDGVDAFNRRDWCAMDSLHHPDVVYMGPLSRCVGRETTRQRYEELVAAVPNLRGFDLQLVDVRTARRRAEFVYQQVGTLLHDLPTPGGMLLGTRDRFLADTEMTLTFDADGLIVAVDTRWRIAVAA
jgi:hypothetical protein